MNYIISFVIITIILSVIKKLFKKSDKSEDMPMQETTSAQDENKKEENPYVPLEQGKLEALFRKYNCKSDDTLYLELYEKKENNEELTDDELIILNNPELKKLVPMAELLNAEINFFDIKIDNAIRAIMMGFYIPNTNNPVHLIINFVLTFFESEYRNNYENADKLLIESFPLMHEYIKFQILQNFRQIPSIRPFDRLDAFQEFIDFIAKHFDEKFPIKDIRDSEIRRNFPKFSGNIIAKIESK